MNHQRTLKTVNIILTLWANIFKTIIPGEGYGEWESAHWRKSLSNKSCSQEHIQVISYLQYQHPGHIIPSISTSRSYHTFDVNIQVISYLQYQHPGHIITLMYGLCNYQRTTYSLGTIWSIQIHFDISWSLLLWTYILNTGWKMENTAAKLATPKGRDFRVLLHWLFSVSFKILKNGSFFWSSIWI